MKFNNDKAIYLQIADYFCQEILIKKLKANDRISSVRDLALETEVNPNTVMRTYQHLQDLNIIYNKRGIGYFIANDAYEITYKMAKQNFVNVTLNDCFNTMKILNISISEVETLFKEFNKTNNV